VVLAGAALIVAVLGALVLSGYLWPGPKAPSTAIDPAQVQRLEGRTLHFTSVAPGAQCPLTPITLGDTGLGIGGGPVRITSNDTPIATDWGAWAAYLFEYSPRGAGVVLLRARDLEGTEHVAFAQYPLGPSAITAAGAVTGIDHLAGKTSQIHSEAVFQDAAHTPALNARGVRPPLMVMIGKPGAASHCIGLQIDGPDFTENLVIHWSGTGL
jgi:hypothetical protein